MIYLRRSELVVAGQAKQILILRRTASVVLTIIITYEQLLASLHLRHQIIFIISSVFELLNGLTVLFVPLRYEGATNRNHLRVMRYHKLAHHSILYKKLFFVLI